MKALEAPQQPDPHIQELLRRTKELLDLHHTSLEALAIAADSQRGMEHLLTGTANTTTSISARVKVILKTSLEVLGVTTRTQRLVAALRRGRLRATVDAVLFDEWIVLWLYLVLHPFFPGPLETAAAVWQFVLFAQRVWWLPADLRGGGWSVWSYFTSPWKALVLLHWVNRQCLAAGAACAGGPAWSFHAPLVIPPFQLCWEEQHVVLANQLNCLAVTGLEGVVDWGRAFVAAVAVPGFYAQLRFLIEFEETVAHAVAYVLWSVFQIVLQRTSRALLRTVCKIQIEWWAGTLYPFSFICRV